MFRQPKGITIHRLFPSRYGITPLKGDMPHMPIPSRCLSIVIDELMISNVFNLKEKLSNQEHNNDDMPDAH